MKNTFAEINDLFDPDDRRQWPVLLSASIMVGLARGLILACANEAAARLTKGQPFLYYAAAMAALLTVAVLLGHFTTVRAQFISSRLGIRLRNRVNAGLRASNLRMVELIGVDRLHWHLMSNITVLANSYEVLIRFSSAIVMLVLSFAYVGWLSLWGLLISAGVTVVGIAIHAHQERLNIAAKRQWDREWSEMWARHREFLDGYKELRLTSAKADDFLRRLDATHERIRAVELVEKRHSSLGSLTAYTFQTVLIALIVFGLPVFSSLDGLTALRLLAAILTTVAPLEAVVSEFPALVRTKVALENLRQLEAQISTTAFVDAPRSGPPPSPATFQSVELKGIGFEFAARSDPDAFVLGPIDLKLAPGEIVFVCGGNGSGKSVLLRLLTGLYKPTRGQLLLDGQLVDDARYQEHREHFATVFHDFHLFAELLGHPNIAPQDIEALLAQFDLSGRTSLSDGKFRTVALSTGQRKRLALLVAWLEQRPLVVLDEFGAELDPANRRRFYEEWLPALKAAGKTVVVATHDDAYFDRCDLLVKMDFGRIVSATRMQGQGVAA